MSASALSRWDELFDIAVRIIDSAADAVGYNFAWSFGGGTALMLQIDHRESHDIDLFLDDPQILPFLNPATQDYALSRQPDDYETDGARATKLIFQGAGEIDFIACSEITREASRKEVVRGCLVDLETPAEIIAKKIFYRGSRLQPRDIFDLAAVAEARSSDYVIGALRECGSAKLQSAHAVIQKSDPGLVTQVIGQLMYRARAAHLVERAQAVAADLLEAAIINS